MLIKGWLVLPDRPDTQRARIKWPSQSRWTLAHASGNSWLVGSLDQEVTLASVGSLRVAVIGLSPITAGRLADLVTRVRTVAELDAVARVLPGHVQLVASMNGVVRVQGSVTGIRRVFHTRIHGVPIAGDQADVLARVANAGADTQELSVHVSGWWAAPPPSDEPSRWPGMRTLAPDHYLQIDSSGTIAELRWPQPPRPDTASTAGAGR